MNRGYYSGLPYSDELYHHGIIGQKWGIRRFQNRDGSRTPEGKKRYGYAEVTDKLKANLKKAAKSTGETLKKVGKATGNVAKKVGKAAVKSYKKKHPSLMTDEELIAFKKRLDMERSYKDALADMKKKSFMGRTMNAIEDIAKQSATKLAVQTADKAAQTLANRLFESDSAKEKRRYEEMIAADKAKRNWESKAYLDKDDKTQSKSDQKGKSSKNDQTIKRDNPIQKAVDDTKQAELDRNKAQAEKEAKRIMEERKKTDREIEERKRKKKEEEFWNSVYGDTLPGYW